MATPRMAAKAGIPKQPPFKGLRQETTKKSGPQPPIPGKKPASSKPFAKKGKGGMSGIGGDKSKGY